MKLSKEQFVQLRSAGFTERQITTMQEKFFILLNTVNLPEPVHLHNIRVLKQQVTLLRDKVDWLRRYGCKDDLAFRVAQDALAATKP